MPFPTAEKSLVAWLLAHQPFGQGLRAGEE